MPDVTVRPLLPAEHGEVGKLRERTVAAYRSVPGDAHTSSGSEGTLRDVGARARDAVGLVAVGNEGTLLGGVASVPGPEPLAELERDGGAGIRMLAVSPAAHRRGVGRALVEHTAPSMTAARGLYGTLSFARARHLDGLVPGAKLMA
ncbi:MAG TPA: GNAT family N-acetyltransferase [Gaiellales bacterium]